MLVHSRRHGPGSLALLITLALLGGACSPPANADQVGEDARVETAVAATLAFEVAVNTAAAALVPTATGTPESTPTPLESATPLPTETSTTISIRAEINTNCRTGPDPVYPVIGYLTVGEPSTVLGQLNGGGWWYIANSTPGRDACWVWGQTTIVDGDPSALPFVTPPPTPTPLPGWTGNWNTYIDGEGNFNFYIQQSGDNISAAFSSVLLFGMLSDYNRNAAGSLISATPTVNAATATASPPLSFSWRLLSNGNQFTGYLQEGGTKYAWCGARSGYSLPSPCLGP